MTRQTSGDVNSFSGIGDEPMLPVHEAARPTRFMKGWYLDLEGNQVECEVPCSVDEFPAIKLKDLFTVETQMPTETDAVNGLSVSTVNQSSHQQTIAARAKKYGDYILQAKVAQDIKSSMVLAHNWESMQDTMRESLEMIATKISRILTGDIEDIDSWHDIAGYATLIENQLRKANEVQSRASKPPG